MESDLPPKIQGKERLRQRGTVIKHLVYTRVAQMVKNLPAVQETWIPSPDWKDSLEK